MNHRPPPEPLVGTLLEGAGVHAGYPGVAAVLECASVQVRAGIRLAVVGRNGSGKTTLLRCLSGAHRPAAGVVRTPDGELTHTRAGLHRHRRQVQLVLQDPDDQLFAARVDEDVSFGPMNLGLPVPEAAARVAEALDLLGIPDLAERPTHHLSFGQRKRVAIAGALAMRPRVLLLDEPTAGLDQAGTDLLLAALARLEDAGTTVVLSTHDVDLAWQWADEVAVVDGGRVHQDLLVKGLTDESLVTRAGLRLPWPVRLLRLMGVPLDPSAPPRTADDVAAVLAPGRPRASGGEHGTPVRKLGATSGAEREPP